MSPWRLASSRLAIEFVLRADLAVSVLRQRSPNKHREQSAVLGRRDVFDLSSARDDDVPAVRVGDRNRDGYEIA